jgi:predicted Zn-ribbon and HTH transcriptional regulator
MRRKFLAIVAVTSLVLMAALAELMVRSYWRLDSVRWSTASRDHWIVSSMSGRFWVSKIENSSGAWITFWDSGYYSTDAEPTIPMDRSFADFGYQHRTMPEGISATLEYTTVSVPQWVLAPLLAMAPFVWWRRRRAWRNRPGFCPRCGYDIRANPGRCSECGHEMASDETVRSASSLPFRSGEGRGEGM